MTCRSLIILALAPVFAAEETAPAAHDAGIQETQISLRVSDAEGEPVSGAIVTSWSPDLELLARAATDERGRARLAALSGGEAFVLVNAQGFRPARYEVSDADGEILDVRLNAGRSLELRVEEIGSGRPVESFDVIALPADAGASGEAADAAFLMAGAVREQFEESESPVRIHGLPDEPVVLMITAPGFPPTPYGPVDPRGDETARVVVDSSGCLEHVVTDAATREALAGARAIPDVPLREGVGNDEMIEIARSDENGSLTICSSGRGPGRVVIVKQGYAPVAFEAPGPDAASSSVRRIELGPAALLDVRVAYPDGRPVEAAIVTVRAGGMTSSSTTSSRGIASLETLAADPDALIEVRLADDESPAGEARTRLMAGQKHVVRIDIEAAISVTIRFDGRPLEDALAYLAARDQFTLRMLGSSTTSADGSAEFHLADGVPADAVLVLRTDGGAMFVDWRETVARDDDPLQRSIDLPGRVAAGRVVSDEGGEVSGAVVACSRRASGSNLPLWGLMSGEGQELHFDRAGRDLALLRPGSVAVTDARGRFELYLPGDCGYLNAAGPVVSKGEAPWGTSQVSWWDLDEDDPIEVTLSRNAALDVLIEGPTARPVTISARTLEAPGQVRIMKPAATGQVVSLKLNSHGPWIVLAQGDGLVGLAGPVSTPRGQVVETNLALEEGGFLVVGSGDTPGAAGLHVIDGAGLDWARFVNVTRDPDVVQRMRVGPIPAGEYTVISGGREESVRLAYPGEVRAVF